MRFSLYINYSCISFYALERQVLHYVDLHGSFVFSCDLTFFAQEFSVLKAKKLSF